MKRVLSSLLVAAVLALSAASVASARAWNLPSAKPPAPAKHHLKKASKANYSPYYRGA